MLDVLIIGAGPIGMACGIAAQKRGLSYLIVEKGCLVNSIYHYPTNMTFFSTADRLEIGQVPFVAHGDKPTRREALDYYRRVAMAFQLQLRLYEEVTAVNATSAGTFIVQTSKAIYTSRNIVFATGFYGLPNLLGIPGEDLPKVRHYYDEAHPYAFQKVAVVGAANSAVDVALETWRRGAQVTMIIRSGEIRSSVKYWVKPDIENRIKEGSIKAYFHSHLVAIRPDEIDVQTPEGLITLPNDFVLAMTGYRPDFRLLQMAGVQFTNDSKHAPLYNPDTHQTNAEGVYVAGVVCGGMETNKWFIENSRDHAEKIMQHIARRLATCSAA
ncbi:MAG: YpdA family putative bacillithiol disulfide reductase [Cytophagales bacterium]|nr:YpdA family putative bacillithiol disulfide reductase [Bernardetiaceae bacterium]MDW8210947.1 YpdA family putative bacillithiol disulfide reductase [Cytophagales bacterium]